jgi:hypothetical protein
MDENLVDALQELVDRQKISDCLLKYARAVDRLDEELFRSIFYEDALIGKRTVTEFWEYLAVQRPIRQACQHFATNHLMEFDGDTAHTETSFISAMKMVDGSTGPARGPSAPEPRAPDEITIVGGRYLDRFERRNGKWLIAFRLPVGEWQLIGDGSRMQAYLDANGNQRRRDRTDPSYLRPLVPS